MRGFKITPNLSLNLKTIRNLHYSVHNQLPTRVTLQSQIEYIKEDCFQQLNLLKLEEVLRTLYAQYVNNLRLHKYITLAVLYQVSSQINQFLFFSSIFEISVPVSPSSYRSHCKINDYRLLPIENNASLLISGKQSRGVDKSTVKPRASCCQPDSLTDRFSSHTYQWFPKV